MGSSGSWLPGSSIFPGCFASTVGTGYFQSQTRNSAILVPRWKVRDKNCKGLCVCVGGGTRWGLCLCSSPPHPDHTLSPQLVALLRQCDSQPVPCPLGRYGLSVPSHLVAGILSKSSLSIPDLSSMQHRVVLNEAEDRAGTRISRAPSCLTLGPMKEAD